jgi:hypothetical protein
VAPLSEAHRREANFSEGARSSVADEEILQS